MISTLISLRLQHAAQRLADRLAQLEERLQSDEAAAWTEFREVAVALCMILPMLAPGARGELLTTKQMAERARRELEDGPQAPEVWRASPGDGAGETGSSSSPLERHGDAPMSGLPLRQSGYTRNDDARLGAW